ncbi:MAG: DNA adenine methylase [Candidatus Dadabacteria bacterium]|nr:MAG: DNA adenine methylase [Candidatus Dadabacteria bacterium]
MTCNALKNPKQVKAKPFIKWAGGKSQLLEELINRVPKHFNRYFEPFLGGGALFFALRPVIAHLSDINPELINVYQVVRDNPDLLIEELSKHKYEKIYYYKIRNVDRYETFNNWSNTKRAARLIYLNKTCFNGLYRVNSRGEFNVPFGRHKNPTICDTENLIACSELLQSAEISVKSFELAVKDARADDFVYFDPPYAPLNKTSNFTGYSKNGFDEAMQVKLKETCVELNRKGVKFMLSNSSAAIVLELYKDFNVEFVKASRAINSNAAKRGKINEIIVRNYS